MIRGPPGERQLKKNIESSNLAKHAKITTISNLKVIYANCDSLSNKFEEMEFVIKLHNPHIIVLTEVAPKNNRYPLQKSEIELDDYELFVNDLNKKGHRGVAIYVKKSVYWRMK